MNNDPLPVQTPSPSICVQAAHERRFTYVHEDDSVAAPSSTAALNSPPRTSQMGAQPEINAKCFRFLAHIGEGSFSEVYRCREMSSNRLVAIKCCEKLKIKREKKVQYIKREKDIMAKLKHPLFVHLFYTFQDETRLYFVMTLAPHGELLNHMRRVGSLDVNATSFYAAEMVLALQYLHYDIGVIHRDLKPENILLSETNHIMLSDFGSAKILTDEAKELMLRTDATDVDDDDEPPPSAAANAAAAIRRQHPVACTDSDDDAAASNKRSERRSSFVGTAQYVSPELLNGRTALTFAADYWALGCIVYQMIAGLPPFRDASEYGIFKRVRDGAFTFPAGFPAVPKDFVTNLLVVNVRERLGSAARGGIAGIKRHPFFDGIKWDDLLSMEPPRIMPYLPASGDEPEHRSTTLIYDAELDEPSIEPGLDGQLNRLHGLGEVCTVRVPRPEKPTVVSAVGSTKPAVPVPLKPTRHSLCDITAEERKRRLREQRENDQFHRYVQENLILKRGFCEKKVGLFARNRMFLLTEGPHLYYVDTVNNELKGEVPFSPQMRTEAKNFKTFFIHTLCETHTPPSRIYYLTDRDSNAQQWCDAIDDVRDYYYMAQTPSAAPPSADQ